MGAAMKPISYAVAIEKMRRPDTRLIQTHGTKEAGFYIVPHGGPVSGETAARIMNHPLVRPGYDALFPGMSQTWAMLHDRPLSAS
jgi:hypothetical protein